MDPDEGTGAQSQPALVLKLFIAGESSKSKRAIENLERMCAEHMRGDYRVEVVDIQIEPSLAKQENIFVVPTLVRTSPVPTKRVIGDLSNFDEVRRTLDLP